MSKDHKSLPQKNHLSLVKIAQSPSESPMRSSLRFVKSNGISSPIQKSEPSQRHYFTSEVWQRSPYDLVMMARDPFHHLHCELPLKFEEREEVLSLVCQFPTICDEELIDYIEEDEILLGMTLIQFHMQILKNLLLFGAARNATNLIIKTTEDQFVALGIYRELTKHIDKIPTKNGMDIEILIPIHVDACNGLIDDITEQFRKTLWQDYTGNQSIRHYLAANVRFNIMS